VLVFVHCCNRFITSPGSCFVLLPPLIDSTTILTRSGGAWRSDLARFSFVRFFVCFVLALLVLFVPGAAFLQSHATEAL